MNHFVRSGFAMLVGTYVSMGAAHDLKLPILEQVQLGTIDLGAGDRPAFRYHVIVTDDSGSIGSFYTVLFRIIPTALGHPLRASTSRVDFQTADLIGSGSADYQNQVGNDWITISVFEEIQPFVGASWRYVDTTATGPGSFAKTVRTQTEFIIGFRFEADDGIHYGWMRFSRPDTNFLTFFDLTAYDWNPLPGESIGAGQPPAIPLAHEVTAQRLRLSWPVGAAGWPLEMTDRLGPDADWMPVPEAGGTEAVIPFPEANRFYRLKRP